MSELGNPERKTAGIEDLTEGTENPENSIKETSKEVISRIEGQKPEAPEKKEALDSLIGCIEKFGNFTEKVETSDVKSSLNEFSDSLQEFKGQNEKLDKAIDSVTDKIKDVSERIEKDEDFSFKDFVDAFCAILRALLPIILAIF
jgi:methyl-accepting chemotaxis protein